jgi:hypothetical protein
MVNHQLAVHAVNMLPKLVDALVRINGLTNGKVQEIAFDALKEVGEVPDADRD